MNDSVKKKKKYVIKVGNRGFTLIELLAVIAILAVIVSIVVYFSLRIVNNANEKSYAATINNIEDEANNYILENSDFTTWMPTGVSGSQYQCVKVQDLIDVGYFKGDVLESKIDKNTYVEGNNYIYVERNSNHAITKSILLAGDGDYSKYLSLCGRRPVAATYTVSYDANGGSGAPANQTKTKGVSLTLSNVKPTKSDWRFVEWNTKPDGSGTSYNPGDIYDKNLSVTLYAQWSDKKIFTITYVKVEGLGPGAAVSDTAKYCKNAKGDVSGTMMQTTCVEGEDCTLSKNTFSRVDLKFVGWTITEYSFNSSTKPLVKYTDGQVIVGGLTEDLTLYTVWSSSHDLYATATGVSLINNFGTSKFNCGHYHSLAYTNYCSKCHMSVSHYNICYKPAYETRTGTLHCPVGLSSFVPYLVDDNELSKNDYEKAKYWGGTIEGNEKLKIMNKTEFVSAGKH